MSNIDDFIIENGVLKKYTGADADVIVPEGVTEIESYAFTAGDMSIVNNTLVSVKLPNSLTSIN